MLGEAVDVIPDLIAERSELGEMAERVKLYKERQKIVTSPAVPSTAPRTRYVRSKYMLPLAGAAGLAAVGTGILASQNNAT